MKVSIVEDIVGETEVIIRCERADRDIQQLASHIDSFVCHLSGRAGDGHTEVLPLSEVLYFESVDGRTFAYTCGAVLEIAAPLYALESRFANDGFVRISRSVVASLRNMRSLRPDLGRTLQATMKNGESLHVSRKYAPALRERLQIRRSI